MQIDDIRIMRLHAQRLLGEKDDAVADIVKRLGMVQSQDYIGAKWAVGQRIKAGTNAMLETVMHDGTIIRTHVLRPTWHFILASDARWMLTLSRPRLLALSAYYFRKYGLDESVFAKTNAIIAEALSGGRECTRAELTQALKEGSIDTSDNIRLAYIFSMAELDMVVCSGGLRGKQQTYAAFESRVPETPEFEHDAALKLLAERYFSGHGPATFKDYAWWSGLSARDAKKSFSLVQGALSSVVIEGQEFWFTPGVSPMLKRPHILLLPDYDEYIVAFADRSMLFDRAHQDRLDSRGNVLFNNAVICDGRIVGVWSRSVNTKLLTIVATLFIPFDTTMQRALAQAVADYGKFLDVPAKLDIAG